MNILLRFWYLRIYLFVFYREDKPLSLRFYPPLLDYDVYLHELVELVTIFDISPSSLKSESGCSSCGYLYLVGFVGTSPMEMSNLSY